MSGYLIFGGIDSRDYDVFVSFSDIDTVPRRVYTKVDIVGKNGSVLIDEGKYEDVPHSYDCIVLDNEKRVAFVNAIMSKRGYQRLTDSYGTDEYYTAVLEENIEQKTTRIRDKYKFKLVFTRKPQRFLTSGEEPVDTSELGGEVTTDNIPYLFRRSGGGNIEHDFDAEIDKIIGGTVAWNQLVANSGSVSVTVPSGHKYFSNIGGTKAIAISNGSAISATGGTDNIVDITQMLGSTIADYVYSLEQTTAGAGVAWLKSHGFLTKDYYAYNEGGLLSVKTSAHVMRDENDVVIATYPLDPNLELRGIPKLSNGSLYYDGDVYPPSGEVERKYKQVTFDGSEDENWTIGSSGGHYRGYIIISDIKSYGGAYNVPCQLYICSAFTNGTWNNVFDGGAVAGMTGQNWGFGLDALSITDATGLKSWLSSHPIELVYELATPTTETAQPYASPQVVNPLGTEQYVDTRDVPVPVGHETMYGMSQLVLTNPTEFPSKPLLEVTGVGTFWLGDTLFTITGTAGQTIYIDCETGEAWKNTGGIITPANGLVTLNRLDFPELDPGDTPVMYGTGITKVVVTPRWWRL